MKTRTFSAAIALARIHASRNSPRTSRKPARPPALHEVCARSRDQRSISRLRNSRITASRLASCRIGDSRSEPIFSGDVSRAVSRRSLCVGDLVSRDGNHPARASSSDQPMCRRIFSEISCKPRKRCSLAALAIGRLTMNHRYGRATIFLASSMQALAHTAEWLL